MQEAKHLNLPHPILTDEQLKTADNRLLHNIKYAHGWNYLTSYKIAITYPNRYFVTAEQIEAAAKILEEKKKTFLEEFSKPGVLIFAGMGSYYDPRYSDDVCNHRIRTYFTNRIGKEFFIEVGTGRGHEMRIDHAQKEDLRKYMEAAAANIRRKIHEQGQDHNHSHPLWKEFDAYRKQSYRCYDIERLKPGELPKYTKQNVIDFINKNFDANYDHLVIDEYLLSADECKSQSKK